MFFGCLPCCGGVGPCECGDYAQTLYCTITASLRDGTIFPQYFGECENDIASFVSSRNGRYVLPWTAQLGGWSYSAENQAFLYCVAGTSRCSLAQTRISFNGSLPVCFGIYGGRFEQASWVAGPVSTAIPSSDCNFWLGAEDRVFSHTQQNSIFIGGVGNQGGIGGVVEVTVTLSTNPAP